MIFPGFPFTLHLQREPHQSTRFSVLFLDWSAASQPTPLKDLAQNCSKTKLLQQFSKWMQATEPVLLGYYQKTHY